MLINAFASGWLMDISAMKEDNGATLKRLVDVDDVWSLRVRKPPPGWCILGRFLGPGVFVALKIHDRRDLDGDKYTLAGNEIVEVWRAVLGDQEPFRHPDIGEYVTGVWHNVDQKEG